jgi:hypothetical protein
VAELTELTERFPALHFEEQEGGALVSGKIPIVDVRYSVSLVVPNSYPEKAPILLCDPAEVPWELDRHVFQGSRIGHACLCARIETRKHWPLGSSLASFIQALVVPFFTCQSYYDAHGAWPPDLGRSHGRDGILEAMREVMAEFQDVDEASIIRMLVLLARKNQVKGHELCPCGSNLRLRNCHIEEFRAAKRMIDPCDAGSDLRTLNIVGGSGRLAAVR